MGSLGPWLEGRSWAQLRRTNPLAVASDLGLDPGLTIDAFLAGVLGGWFDLRWDYHCPHCDGIPDFSHHLSESHGSGYCDRCKVSFRNELDQNVEVTFSPGSRLASFISEAPESSAIPGSPFSEGRESGPLGRLSGLALMHRPLFHQRFGDQVLSVEESLEIRTVVLLFTDIKGSTKLYEQLGDAQAYTLVREHFKILFAAVQAQGGVVVKTIGDAVMASFQQPSAALEAALTVHQSIRALKVPGSEDSVVVKMGLHSGPAIAVTMNGRFDYFGQTVNRAARIQGLARDQEIYFSEAIFQDAPSRRALAARKAAVRRWRTQLKGIEGDQVVYSVR